MPIVPVFCCGAECGVDLAHITLATNASFSTAVANNGLRSVLVNTSAAAGNFFSPVFTDQAIWVVRFYLNYTTLPNATVEICVGSARGVGIFFKSADNKIYAGTSTANLGTTGVAISANTQNLIDMKVDFSANPWKIDAQVNGVAVSQVTNAQAASTENKFTFGNGTSSTATGYYDDLLFSATGIDYPIGGGKVTAHSPTYDGTHNGTGTNFVFGNAGGSITVTSTNVWTVLDDVPLAVNTSDFVNQQTSAAQYIEIGFASTTDTTNGPRAFQMLIGGHHLTTAKAGSVAKLIDNGVTALFMNENASGSSAIAFNTTQYASMVGGSPWTKARFDAVKIRWGYSTDATPDVMIDAAMIEAEWPVGAVTYAITAALAGKGLISAATITLDSAIVAAMAGKGLISAATITFDIPFAATLTGVGLLQATFAEEITAILTGRGSLISALTMQNPVAAIITGTGSLGAATITMQTPIAGTLTGVGSLISALTMDMPINAVLTGTGMLVSAATIQLPIAATVTGTGSLIASITIDTPITGALTGIGTLISAVTIESGYVSVEITATLTGVGSLVATFEIIAAPPAPSAGGFAVSPFSLFRRPGRLRSEYEITLFLVDEATLGAIPEISLYGRALFQNQARGMLYPVGAFIGNRAYLDTPEIWRADLEGLLLGGLVGDYPLFTYNVRAAKLPPVLPIFGVGGMRGIWQAIQRQTEEELLALL